MPTIFTCRVPSRHVGPIALALALVIQCATPVRAQFTQVYSFEPDLEGFHLNGGGLTVTQETSGLGATSGSNSMKLEYADFSTFAGALTENIRPAFTDPLGIDFVRFDLTNTNRYVPPSPQPGVTPTFANLSVTFFGTFPTDPDAQIQFLLTEQAVGILEPGTHQIDIDISNTGGPLGSGGGLYVASGQIKGYDAWIDLGFQPTGFQIYLNKNGRFGDPTFAWTFYIDNIRVGRTPPGVPGDYNENGFVDAADYVLWRKNDGTSNPLPNDNGLGVPIGPGHYDLWRANFGSPTVGNGTLIRAAPEPACAGLLLVGFAFWWAGKQAHVVRKIDGDSRLQDSW